MLSALALASTQAAAQGKPTLIDHPLDVRGAMTAAQREKLQEDFRLALAKKTQILVPTRTGWKMASGALGRQDCDVRDECLRQLAVTGSTLYALYAQVESNAAGTEAIAIGRVVSQDGAAVRPAQRATAAVKGAFADAAREALLALLDKLELEKLPAVLSSAPATPPVAVTGPAGRGDASTDPLPPPPPPPAPEARVDRPTVMKERTDGSPTLRAVGVVALATGIVSGAVALGFGISAATAKGTLPSDGRLMDEAQVQKQADLNRDASLALGLGVGAGVLAATSIVLFIASAPTERPRVAVTPTRGGGALVISGEF